MSELQPPTCGAVIRYSCAGLADVEFACELAPGHDDIHLARNPVTIVTWTRL